MRTNKAARNSGNYSRANVLGTRDNQIIASDILLGVFGALVGMIAKRIRLSDGEFGGRDLVAFIFTVIVGHAVAWFAVAPALDIIIYAEPANKVFIQGLFAGASNIVTTLIIGLLLCYAYAAAKPKKGSLKEEK